MLERIIGLTLISNISDFSHRRMEDSILPRVEAFCKANSLRPLLIVYAGSIANGVASTPVNDHDVRGIVVRSLEAYVTLDEVSRKVDSFSLDEGSLDLQLWDVRKACWLLATSNQRATEMLSSSVVLFSDSDFVNRLKKVTLANLSPFKLGMNYKSDAEAHFSKHIDKLAQVNRKKYLYYLRGVLSLLWLSENSNSRNFPPVNFDELLSAVESNLSVQAALEARKLFREKREGRFVGQLLPPVPELDALMQQHDLSLLVSKLETARPLIADFDQLIADTILKFK